MPISPVPVPQLSIPQALARFCLALCCGSLFAAPIIARAQGTPSLTPLYSFPANGSAAGTHPFANLALGSDGNYYGTTSTGGANGSGTVFKMTPAGALTTIYTFSSKYGGANGAAANSDGANPNAGLVIASNGLLYGTTSSGGTAGEGTVFSLTTAGALTTLYNFDGGTDGSYPKAPLVADAGGNLFGTTEYGGLNGTGTIFKITQAGALTTMRPFNPISDGSNGYTGAYPVAALVVDASDNLYGTTPYGGTNNCGTLFKETVSNSFSVLHTFSRSDNTNTDGAAPEAALTLAADGSLYGTAEYGGQDNYGSLFKFTKAGVFTPLYNFSEAVGYSNPDGAFPTGSLLASANGDFYGTASRGGDDGAGTVFQLTPAGVLTALHSFSDDSSGANTDGAYPSGSLTAAPTGQIYGTTAQGGASNDGTTFALSLSGVAPVTSVASTRFDFNQDGHADLIWYNTGSGALSVWDMNDTTVLQFGAAFAQLAPSSGWQPVAAPDVNGDGVPDLIWWNNQTGELSPWTLAAGTPPTVTNFGADFATVSDTTWKPVAAADVTGTTWELVFQNTVSGDISRWLMNGTTVVQYGGTLSSVGAGSGWQCVGAPDLDGDGKSDLLFWNSQTGEVSYWSTDLNANTVLAYHGDFAQVSDTSWHLQGSEDTNGDGSPDLIWWNANSGIESRWLLNGTTVTQYGGGETQVTDTTWQPTAIR